MAHIKKLVIHGFKSFAKRTEILFDKGINVIIGPNGSGKSNISDAICFALGRLSAKSMRAEKATSLIFMGSKYVKPAKEAVVEIVFDNSDRAFSIEADEIVLKRIVKSNGTGVYKINDDTKNRSEIIETLAQAGIDPYGYNLILQGQIQSIVKMHGDERRKIIGEVAGISVYEWRKEKSIKELDKTESRLKEISTVLRERTSYLNNLEKERSAAQKYKDLQLMIKRLKASILSRRLEDKTKEVDSIVKAIKDKTEQKDSRAAKTEHTSKEIEELSEKVNQINQHIKDATGMEQGRLREEITNLRADLEGLKVRREGHEHRKEEIERRINEMKNSVPGIEGEIKDLRIKSPMVAKKAGELKKKKEELAELEKERKKIFTLKSEINSLRDRIEDKKRQLAKTTGESESLVKQLEELSSDLVYRDENDAKSSIENLKKHLAKEEDNLELFREQELESEKIISVSNSEIERSEDMKNKVKDLDICPLCQSQITQEHINHVKADSDKTIVKAQDNLESAKEKLANAKQKRDEARTKIAELEKKINSGERELSRFKTINDKKASLKVSTEYEAVLRKEISELENKKHSLDNKSQDTSKIEEEYENKIHEIEEISSRTEEDVGTTLLYKERELEKIKNIVERSREDLQSIIRNISDITKDLTEKGKALEGKEKKEKELNERFKKMFADRDSAQKLYQETSLKLSELQGEVRAVEDQINYLKIGKAKLDSEKETIEIDLAEYQELELIQGSLNSLDERLKKAQVSIETIGPINMRALEVYQDIKKEYDSVKEKVDTLQKEKDEILKIIEEIDKKKRRTFMRTFRAINEIFTRNFSKLSSKGIAYLELEKPTKKKEKDVKELEEMDDVAESHVNIVVKMAKGKYFDVHSLSGGEQTLVALSLLFAIQEYRPYQFYILDEIDAALDKRNSERLAGLLNQYMKSGQYIVVTHNDAIILDSNILYGVSMHEGVSKILSLRVGEDGQQFGEINMGKEDDKDMRKDESVKGDDKDLPGIKSEEEMDGEDSEEGNSGSEESDLGDEDDSSEMEEIDDSEAGGVEEEEDTH